MKVLLAVADEEFGTAIADFVTSHHWPESTIFKVLHVIEWTPPERELAAISSLRLYLEERQQYANAVSVRIIERIKRALPGYTIEEVILPGSPVARIVSIANSWQADMIIVGSHGRKGMSLFILGSVSLGVVTNASCTVVVIRLPARASPGESTPSSEKTA